MWVYSQTKKPLLYSVQGYCGTLWYYYLPGLFLFYFYIVFISKVAIIWHAWDRSKRFKKHSSCHNNKFTKVWVQENMQTRTWRKNHLPNYVHLYQLHRWHKEVTIWKQLLNARITMILFWKLQIICLNPSFDFNSTLYLEMSINSKFMKKLSKELEGKYQTLVIKNKITHGQKKHINSRILSPDILTLLFGQWHTGKLSFLSKQIKDD